jgi:hypothetical protein
MTASFGALIAQVLLWFGLGWPLSCGRPSGGIRGEGFPPSVLAGGGIGTTILFLLLLAGVPLMISVGILSAAAAAGVFLCFRKRKPGMPRFPSFSLKWYEAALLAVLAGKILFALAVLWQTPLFFEDAMTHWSGRARSLFGGVNWSFDPASPVFLGFTGAKHYPLGIPLWRASAAAIAGGWDDFIARADGLVFYGLVVATVWFAVMRFSGRRWLAAAGAFVVAALPLQAIHAVSGYGDIAVEAFFVGAVAALLRREWLMAGLLAAGTAWMKNDGLVIAVPALAAAACLLLGAGSVPFRALGKEDGRKMLLFLSGLLPLAPWLIFKAVHGLGVTPGGQSLSWHPEAWAILRDTVLLGPTHSIFWIFTLAVLLTCGGEYLRDRQGTALLVLFVLAAASSLFVFTCTDAFLFLENQTTIHRTMLQLYGVTVVVCFYGIHLKLDKAAAAAAAAAAKENGRKKTRKRGKA